MGVAGRETAVVLDAGVEAIAALPSGEYNPPASGRPDGRALEGTDVEPGVQAPPARTEWRRDRAAHGPDQAPGACCTVGGGGFAGSRAAWRSRCATRACSASSAPRSSCARARILRTPSSAVLRSRRAWRSSARPSQSRCAWPSSHHADSVAPLPAARPAPPVPPAALPVRVAGAPARDAPILVRDPVEELGALEEVGEAVGLEHDCDRIGYVVGMAPAHGHCACDCRACSHG